MTDCENKVILKMYLDERFWIFRNIYGKEYVDEIRWAIKPIQLGCKPIKKINYF